MQNDLAFSQLRGRLTVNHFSEESHQLLYRVLEDYYKEHEELPPLEELYAEATGLIESEETTLDEGCLDDLQELIDYASDPKTFADYAADSTKMTRFCVRVGRDLLERKQAIDLKEQLQDADPDKLPAILENAQQELMAARSLSLQQSQSVFLPQDWDKQAAFVTRTTGMGWIDRYMGGGERIGEVYGFLAPYGTCKTTLGVQLWTESAIMACAEAGESDGGDGSIGLSVFVSFEAPKLPELAHRALMCTTRVRRDSLDSMGIEGLDKLGNDSANPKAYEKKIFKDEIAAGAFVPERKRIEDMIPLLNEHAVCFDFSGADTENPSAGVNGIDEIVARLKMELKFRGPKYRIRTVIVDYVGIMIDRDIKIKRSSREGEDHKTYQMAVQRFGKEVAKPFGCCVWLLHQLSGEANSAQSVTKKLHHTDAKGSKSFAENLDFSFVCGQLTIDQLGQVACTKQRRFKRMLPTIIQVDGEFNQVRAPDNYIIDSDGKIVDKTVAKTSGFSVDQLNDGDSGNDDPPSGNPGGNEM
jgi:hypothetical protein